MTEKEIKSSVGRVLLPEYERMIPVHDEHEFSSEFETQMSELIGRKKKRRHKAEREKNTAYVRSSHWQTFAMAAAVFVVFAAAAVFVLYNKGMRISKTKSPDIAQQTSSSQSSERDIGLSQLKILNDAANEMRNQPDKFYAEDFLYLESGANNTSYKQSESMVWTKESAAAKALGECLIAKSIVRYLGSAVWEGQEPIEGTQEYYLKLAEKTVDYKTEEMFKNKTSCFTIRSKVYASSFSVLKLIVSDGAGYLQLEINSRDSHKAEFLYYSFTLFDHSFELSDITKLKDWETNCVTNDNIVSKEVFARSDGKQVIVPMGWSFRYSVDNTGSMPVVNITELDLPPSEKVSGGKLEIFLCKKSENSSAPIKAAVISSDLKEGSFDFSGYTSYISKQDIDGIMIQVTFNTDIHPAPETEKTSQKTAYSLTAYYGV